ncbi:MAG TPA: ABC transporter ATP-binding protein [Gemmatimonadaceae bacterium]|nr:ABC transporter ATP-binding protein [Gemmatimonadaceae bacterium]
MSTLCAPPSLTHTVVAEDVTKRYDDGRHLVDALRGATLAIAPGEIVALEGPSGSGKTTLLSILGCILSPTSGHVTVAGVPVERATSSELAAIRRKYIGFVFQHFNLFPSLTAVENVAFALKVKRLGDDARRQAEAALEAVSLSDRRDFLPCDLSGGQKQRVAIARAIAGNPPLLLADEPTANLDSDTAGRVLSLLQGLVRERGHSLLVVTHDPSVRSIADRVLTIRDGRLAQ